MCGFAVVPQCCPVRQRLLSSTMPCHAAPYRAAPCRAAQVRPMFEELRRELGTLLRMRRAGVVAALVAACGRAGACQVEVCGALSDAIRAVPSWSALGGACCALCCAVLCCAVAMSCCAALCAWHCVPPEAAVGAGCSALGGAYRAALCCALLCCGPCWAHTATRPLQAPCQAHTV